MVFPAFLSIVSELKVKAGGLLFVSRCVHCVVVFVAVGREVWQSVQPENGPFVVGGVERPQRGARGSRRRRLREWPAGFCNTFRCVA